MKAERFKKSYYSAANAFSDCWKDGWTAKDFTLWHHSDVNSAGTGWHIAKAVQAIESGFEAWVQFWDRDSKLTISPERKAFQTRLAKALRRMGYEGKSSIGLFRKRVRTIVALRQEWQALREFSGEVE